MWLIRWCGGKISYYLIDNILSKTIRNNIAWSMLERFGTVGVQFLIQLILARLLNPDDYGLCAILLVFVNIFTLLVDSGLPIALVQNKCFSQRDYSSVFYTVLGMSIVAYAIIYVSAPFCAIFFENPMITSTLRLMSISIIFGSINSVQVAYIKHNMLFKTQFIANTISITLSAVISIYMAINGLGVWAIVAQYLIGRVVVTLLLSIMLTWRPTWEFSYSRLKSLFSYGWKLMATNFLSLAVSDIYTALIGKMYTSDRLGVYDTGTKIPTTISNSMTMSIGAVLFPLFSKHQDDKAALKYYLGRSNIITSFFVFPLMFSMAACSDQIVMVVLTEKWTAAIPFMQIACIMHAFYPIHLNNLHVINALGRSDIGLKLEIIKKAIDMLFLVVFISIGLEWVAIGRMLTSIISLVINLKPNAKLINYSVSEQIKEVLPTFCISIITSLILVFIGKFLTCSNIVGLLIQMLVGLSIYTMLSYVFNRKDVRIVLSVIKGRSN